MNKRIKYIGLLLILLMAPLTAFADDAPRIWVLNSNPAVDKYQTVQDAFIQTMTSPVHLMDLSKTEQVEQAAGLLEKGRIDLIYCIGSKAYQIGHRYGLKAPIVFSSIINWRRLPGRKDTYGVSNELHPVMQMMLFRYIFPQINRIGVIYSKRFNQEWYETAISEAKNIGIELVGRQIETSGSVTSELKRLLPEVDAFWLISDPLMIPDAKRLLTLLSACDKRQVPVFTYNDVFVKYGATLAVSVDDPTVGRQAAGIAGSLIAGEAVAEKVQYPAGSRIVLNMRKVKAYGLSYSRDALGNVNQLIE